MTKPTLPDLDQNTWSINQHILQNLRKPRPGDKKPPTRWPSAGTAISIDEDGEEVVHGKCRRQAFFRIIVDEYDFNPEKHAEAKELVERIKREEIPPDDRIRYIWAQGELYEDYIIKQAKSSGIFVYEQVQIYVPEYNISGRVDLVVYNPKTGKLQRVEVKSTSGYAADKVIGRKNSKGIFPGQPKDPNVIQAAIYDWWGPSMDRDVYGPTILKYGARDTGKFAEYLINVDDEGRIWIAQTQPFMTEWVESPITITSICEQYEYVDNHVERHEVPPADFSLYWNEEQLDKRFRKGELTKSDTLQYQKFLDRKEENEARLAEGLEPKRSIALPKKGDFACNYCPYRNTCYNAKGELNEL